MPLRVAFLSYWINGLICSLMQILATNIILDVADDKQLCFAVLTSIHVVVAMVATHHTVCDALAQNRHALFHDGWSEALQEFTATAVKPNRLGDIRGFIDASPLTAKEASACSRAASLPKDEQRLKAAKDDRLIQVEHRSGRTSKDFKFVDYRERLVCHACGKYSARQVLENCDVQDKAFKTCSYCEQVSLLLLIEC